MPEHHISYVMECKTGSILLRYKTEHIFAAFIQSQGNGDVSAAMLSDCWDREKTWTQTYRLDPSGEFFEILIEFGDSNKTRGFTHPDTVTHAITQASHWRSLAQQYAEAKANARDDDPGSWEDVAELEEQMARLVVELFGEDPGDQLATSLLAITADPESSPVFVCPDCGQDHAPQRLSFPGGATVISLVEIAYWDSDAKQKFIPVGTQGQVGCHCDDGRAIITFIDYPGAHTFHYPERALRVK